MPGTKGLSVEREAPGAGLSQPCMRAQLPWKLWGGGLSSAEMLPFVLSPWATEMGEEGCREKASFKVSWVMQSFKSFSHTLCNSTA